jgi:hypothetical protein
MTVTLSHYDSERDCSARDAGCSFIRCEGNDEK